jgi:hypothetical protein
MELTRHGAGPPRTTTRFERNAETCARGAHSVTKCRRICAEIAAAGAIALLLLPFLLAFVPAARASAVGDAARYLESRQQVSGGFAEPGRAADPGLTGWAVLGLAAAGRPPADAAAYLAGKPYPTATDLELRILAFVALGRGVDGLADQLEGLRRSSGSIGPTLNSTMWGILALRAAGRSAGSAVSYLLRNQHESGGWSWARGGAPDSNDTAAAVQALRAAGVSPRARPIRRALAYLRRLQNADGGFELTPGRGSDAPSAAWAIQAFLAARRLPRGAPPVRRQLPVQRGVRVQSGVDDGAGAHGPRP